MISIAKSSALREHEKDDKSNLVYEESESVLPGKADFLNLRRERKLHLTRYRRSTLVQMRKYESQSTFISRDMSPEKKKKHTSSS